MLEKLRYLVLNTPSSSSSFSLEKKELGHIDIVKKLKQWSQSAGNALFSSFSPWGNLCIVKKELIKSGTSETTRNNTENLKNISIHVPNHLKPLNDEQLGHYLAGLIDGDGHFSNIPQLVIVFSSPDISFAYYLKSRLGFGNVRKIKNKNAVRYICKNKTGLSIILSLINGKFVSRFKYEQLIKHNYNKNFNFEILPPSNIISLDNYWLAGFTQADGCFYISIVKSKTHKTGFSVRLEFSIKQNDVLPLKLLHAKLNMGNLSQYSSGIWCYKSSGYKTAALLIDYFDTFNVFAGKYVNYLKFRKVYIMITEGKHLEEKGILKIKSH